MYKTFHNNKDSKGLGLFMSKNQIEAMGGKIEVDSDLEAGTTFKIFIK
jgi:signal transduction histidine kinase